MSDHRLDREYLMTTVITGTEAHRCAPPRYRPTAEWRKVEPPRAWMKPKAAKRAKPLAVPTPYPVGTLWPCPHCDRWWYAALPPAPPRGGYQGGGGVRWRPVRWYHRGKRRAIKAVG